MTRQPKIHQTKLAMESYFLTKPTIYHKLYKQLVPPAQPEKLAQLHLLSHHYPAYPLDLL